MQYKKRNQQAVFSSNFDKNKSGRKRCQYGMSVLYLPGKTSFRSKKSEKILISQE